LGYLEVNKVTRPIVHFVQRVNNVSKSMSTLSQKSATVAENGETTAKFGDCRTFLRQWHFSVSLTYLRQCGQGLMR